MPQIPMARRFWFQFAIRVSGFRQRDGNIYSSSSIKPTIKDFWEDLDWGFTSAMRLSGCTVERSTPNIRLRAGHDSSSRCQLGSVMGEPHLLTPLRERRGGTGGERILK